ncbi:MAG: helix-turn-helix domain-containing protein [Pseudomonadota bacterium]
MLNSNALDIGEVAQRSGLAASTLRYYEERGLIRSIGRHGLRRLFPHEVLDQLAFIGLGRQSGFSLEEISSMATGGGSFAVDREKVNAKADEVDLQIRQLTAVKDLLRHVANCPERDHFECPKFQKLLLIAQRRSNKKKQKRRSCPTP